MVRGWVFPAALSFGCGLALLVGAGGAAQDTEDAAAEGRRDASQPDPDDRRNPRQIRMDSGRGLGPRMEAGAMSVGGSDGGDLSHYRALEPLIGEFIFEGKQWRLPDSDEPSTFSGTWTNSWELDGYYFRSEFRLRGREPRYSSIGFMWWDDATGRYEAHFYNSRSTLRTHRFGRFDEDGRTLIMHSRHSRQEQDAHPEARITFEIVSENRFIFTGYQYRAEHDDWWKTYEMTCARVMPDADDAEPQRSSDDGDDAGQTE